MAKLHKITKKAAQKRVQKSAFSFIEISIILLIISLLMAGILSTKKMVIKSRIVSAQRETANSILNDMDSVYAWFEASSKRSFDDEYPEDTAENSSNGGIANWYDINQHNKKRHATSATSANNPHYYASCINLMPCLKFDGTNDYLSFDFSEFNNTDYAIFVAEKRGKAGRNPFLGKSGADSNNDSIEIGYDSSDKLFLSQGSESGNAYKFTPSPAISSSVDGKARIHSFIAKTLLNGSSNAQHFINGDADASSSALSGSGFDNLDSNLGGQIGRNNFGGSTVYFQGDLGEIIIIQKAVSTQERQAIEAYLLSKWHIERNE